MLKYHIQERLKMLQVEFQSGQAMLAELEAKQTNLRETLLRMSGAIQVLQECLQEAESAEAIADNQPAAEENG